MRILGTADMIAALLLIRGFYSFFIPEVIIYVFAAYLFIKALIFLADIGSIMDIGAGILLVASVSASLPQMLLLIFATFLGIKGLLTLFSGVRF